MQNMSLSEWLRSHSLFAGLPEKTQVQLDGMFKVSSSVSGRE
jgi:hypothetical protein